MSKFYSNGKILISGEYVVLDGATALAVPTTYGQSMKVERIDQPILQWKSLDHRKETWFAGQFRLKNGDLIPHTEDYSKAPEKPSQKQIFHRLAKILKEAHDLNPSLLKENKGYSVTTELDFPQDWGLGTSSTLINNIAQWFEIDAYRLLEKSFGGSGYDIASAQHDHPITFALNPAGRTVLGTGFDPDFKKELFFVHLNQKQSSREAIAHYRRQPKKDLEEAVEKITALSHQMITAQTIPQFELLLEIHETIISQLINIPKIKNQLFPDYPRAIKSLGGWGGDFILAAGGCEEQDYFLNKGYKNVIPFSEMLR